MSIKPLSKLSRLGQSLWLDYIRRDLINSGKLQRLITEDGLSGITSNPAIFEQAIAQSHLYDQDIRDLAGEKKSVSEIYETLSQRDVQSAADIFWSVYEETNRRDGYVSLEINPHLAHDAQGTIEEARRLWGALNRSNILIKIPATLEGLPAIQQLISEGININVTLIFGLPRYQQVTEATISGLEARLAQGKPLQALASVASFFLSRIDSLVDPLVEKFLESSNEQMEIAKKMHGQVAISSAKLAYQSYKEIFSSARFQKLAEQGARTQRLLWASTSTKNPDYSDVKYIEPLIGTNTINTVPIETLDAYRHHGNPKLRLEQNIRKSRWVMGRLPELGINIDMLTQQLEREGIKKFEKPFDKLIEAIATKSSGC